MKRRGWGESHPKLSRSYIRTTNLALVLGKRKGGGGDFSKIVLPISLWNLELSLTLVMFLE